MSPGGLAFAFAAGMLASVNPCGFAMLPAYAGYYLGSGEEGGSRSLARRLADGLVVGAAVTVGFVAVFGAVGLGVSALGSALLSHVPLAVLVIGTLLVGLGAWLAAGRSLELRIGVPVRVGGGRGLGTASVFGAAYGLASLPCTLPVFLLVVGSAFAAGSLLGGLAHFAAYGLGMGAVVVAVSVGAAAFRGVVGRWLRRALPLVQQLSGALLVAAGTYLVFRELRLGPIGDPGPLAVAYAHPGVAGGLLVAGAGAAAAVLWWLAPRELEDGTRTREEARVG